MKYAYLEGLSGQTPHKLKLFFKSLLDFIGIATILQYVLF